MLKINNLTIKYGRTILEDVSVSFPRGTVTIIRGASGLGKSSLLNVLGLIKKPNKECTYSLDDEAIDLEDEKKASAFRLKRISFVFQDNNLIQGLTSIENIMIPARLLTVDKAAVKEKARSFIEYTGLDNVADSYPSSLSGGEEQRAAIARALMNDVDIILADEPTAALDACNSDKIIQLFKKLAHELNKIVIIVSHDDKVSEIADIVYEIEEYKLVMARGSSTPAKEKADDKKAAGRKSIFSFISYYIWKRKKEKILSGVLILITAIIAAAATLFVNLGEYYNEQQKQYVNTVSEKSLFVINDTQGIKVNDHVDAYRITDEVIGKIREIPSVDKVYPYYEFTSYGQGENPEVYEDAEITLIDGTQTIKKITFKNTVGYQANKPQFSIVPLYPEEDISNYLEYGETEANDNNGFIISEALAKDLSDNPGSLIDKMLEVKCHVPTKLKDKRIIEFARDKKTGKVDMNKVSTTDTIIDIIVKKPITIKKEIKGILTKSYSYGKKGRDEKNLILLGYNEMEKILNENKDTNYFKEEGLEESEFKRCSVNVYANSFEDTPEIWSKIEKISPAFFIVSNFADIKNIKSNMKKMRNTMWGITLILIAVVMVMLFFVHFLKSRTRKKEIGILKAMGMTSRDVVMLIGWETLMSSLMTFICSLVIAVILKAAGNKILINKLMEYKIGFSTVVASFTSPASIAFLFFLTFFIVILSSIASIWRASRIDIIDAIRSNK